MMIIISGMFVNKLSPIMLLLLCIGYLVVF